MKALTRAETDRVNNVLRQATDRLSMLSRIPISEDPEYTSDIESSVITEALQHLWSCEGNLSKIKTTSALFDSKDITLLKNTHKAIRSVCRGATNHEAINDKPIVLSDEYMEFLNYLREFKDQTVIKLGTTVEDDEINRNILHDLGDKTRLLQETKRIIDSKLLELHYQRDRQLQDLDDTKAKLQNELTELSKSNTKDNEHAREEATESILKATAEHNSTITKFESRLRALEIEINEAIRKDQDEELILRKEKNDIESLLNDKIDEYNRSMSIRQQELNSIKDDNARDEAEYQILKKHFDSVDAELAKKAYEANLIKSRRDLFKLADQILYDACAAIQRVVRGRIARKKYAKMKAKKRGKGKGGSKGKNSSVSKAKAKK